MNILPWKKQEVRADPEGQVQFDDALLVALLSGGLVTKKMAMEIPSVASAVDLIGGIVASTPIKLYRSEGGNTEEVEGDRRTYLLSHETGDLLTSNELWRAVVRDYYAGKGAYIYINKNRGEVESLHYVDEEKITVQNAGSSIFKDFDIVVNAVKYPPYDFIKILRNTKNGREGVPITKESPTLVETAYSSMVFEKSLVKKGGNKRGFLKSPKKIDKTGLDALREAFSRLYSNSAEPFIVLNDGIDFQESSNTSVEMQLNENKKSNAEEFSKIFHVPADVLAGKASGEDSASIAKLAVIPLMAVIEAALNRDLLKESEKPTMYFSFDKKELLKGDISERFNAYKTAIDANFMQIDEVRNAEDLKPLGLNFVKLGLQDVLYNPETGIVYTPNTNQETKLGGGETK